MDRKQSQDLVKDVFQNSFDKTKFARFIHELLNSYEEAPFVYRGNTIPDAYDQYINTFERIGKYSDEENSVDVLIVHLKKGSTLERARTRQRNFVAWYLNGSRGGKQKDAALVAFVSPDSADWRFSLVKMEYKFEEGKNGRTKVREEFTPAKRWSFLVGSNENSHTAQSRLAPLVEDDKNNPTLKQLEDAFNIEKVTKEFFEKYRELFLRVHEMLTDIINKNPNIKLDFTEKNVNIVDFSKKLLGQIVFLYFLQKKGWFGVPMSKSWGDGDKRFLRTLFGKACEADKNYFNNYLEPLFYEALAKERDDDFYSRFECKIPFLNGGLFDPINNYDWVNTTINIPNDLFSNDRKNLKTGDIGDGILDIFDRYNFTVKEDEPLEKEVAVDPEMLGKVFENLLEVKDRKSKGTYYTPREIVHYMCEQSLINYLATELEGKVSKEDLERLIKIGENVAEHEATYVAKKDDDPDYRGLYESTLPESIGGFAEEIDNKLATIKVCDPAIGSGAFPVGMMSEIVKARAVLSSYIKNADRTIYGFKRDCIQNSLYGVDLDPGAVEIAKLRLWLSLIVDEDNIKQIKPLPNLDYKIMQGNSLLEEFEGIKLFDEKLIAIVDNGKDKQIESLKQKQADLQKEYFELHSQNMLTATKQAELNIELKKTQTQVKKLNQLEKGIVENAGLFDVNSEAKIKADNLKRLHKEFFEANQKSKKDDIKKQIEQLEWDLIEVTLKEQNKVSALMKLEEFKRLNTRPFFLWKLNFAEVFEEKGGFDVVIANPPYIGESGNKEIFRLVAKGSLGNFYQGKMDYLYFFFHLALNISRNKAVCAFITTNYYITATGAKKLRYDLRSRAVIRNLINFNELKIFESALGQHNMIAIFLKEKEQNVAAKNCVTQRKGMANAKMLLDIVNGIDSQTLYSEVSQNDLYDGNNFNIRILGANNVNDPTQKILQKIQNQNPLLEDYCFINQGIVTGANFLTAKNRDKYSINGSEVGDGIFLITNEEVRKLNLSPKEKTIIVPIFKNSDISKYYTNTKNDINLINIKYTDRLNIDDYPKIKIHLAPYKKLLLDRPRTGTLESAFSNGYWYVMTTSRRLDFKAPKIVVPYRNHKNTFGYNEVPWYGLTDIYFITSKNAELHLKYILSLLNSKLYFIWLYNKGKRKGEILELFYEPLSQVPIKKISMGEQKPFIDLTEKIIEITKTDDYLKNREKQERVKDMEHQIDELVYKLYGLTDDEMKIVENKNES